MSTSTQTGAMQTGPGPWLRDEVVGIEDVAHFYTGAEGPPLHVHREAAARFLDDKARGEEGRARAEQELQRCRELFAGLLGGNADSVAILGNASDALHRLIHSIHHPPGANVVTTDLEFSSGVLSLLVLRDQGVDVRIVPSRAGVVELEDLAAAIDEQTSLVLCSASSFVNGARVDAPAVYDLARAADAAFILDATQSLGVVPVSASWADAVVSSSYKWLLGPQGLGFLYLTVPERFERIVPGAGWRSVDNVFARDRFERIRLLPTARRWELGFPSFLGAYVINRSLELLAAVDPVALERHVMTLGDQLVEGLVASGAELLSPADRSLRSANISVRAEHGDRIAGAMLENGVRVWGGDGRVRFSIHGFVDAPDVDAAIQAFRAAR